MTTRHWDTGFWSDPDFEGVGVVGKLLYTYLATNDHCTLSGIYRISARKVAFDLECKEQQVRAAIDELEARKKVVWREPVVWVLGFVRRNINSPKLIAKAVVSVRDNAPELLPHWLEHNKEHLGRWQDTLSGALDTLSIPYPYPTDTLPIPLYRSDQTRSDQTREENTPLTPLKGDSASDAAPSVLDYWNQRTRQKRRSKAVKASIKARLKDHPPEDLRLVIDWAADSKDERAAFLRGRGLEPETVFKASNFEKYLHRARNCGSAAMAEYFKLEEERQLRALGLEP